VKEDEQDDHLRRGGDKAFYLGKDSNIFRVAFININGLSPYSTHPKNDQLKEQLLCKEVYILAMSKTNVNWDNVVGRDSWRERTLS